MPEKEPLQSLAPLQRILEAKFFVGVVLCLEIEELGTCLHDRERGGAVIVNNDWDPP